MRLAREGIGQHRLRVLRIATIATIATIAVLGFAAVIAAEAQAHVYWTARGNTTGSTVGRANLDGTGANPAFIGGASGPVGVAVSRSFIYWANTFSSGGTIGRANLDGSGVNQSFIAGAKLPCGVAVDAAHVYWANNATNSIGRANLDGTGLSNSFITGANQPCGVAVDASHVYWTNEGGTTPGTTIGRANLDGSAANNRFIAGASAPVGVAVSASYIYWGNNSSDTVGRANLDGTGVNNRFITGSGGCSDFPAIDATHIYWANDCDGSIGRANLDGTGINNGFLSVAANPGGVAVDPPPAPTCTLGLRTNKVLLAPLKKSKGKHRPKPSLGTLTLKLSCNQAAAGTLSGKLTERIGKKPAHGEQRAKTFSLRGTHVSLRAGVPIGLVIKLPADALTALSRGASESLTLTLTATNANGTRKVTTTVPRLRFARSG